MSNNLIRDLAGVAPNPRRIKDHSPMIPYGFARLDVLIALIALLALIPLFGGLLVDLLSGYIRSYKQTGIVCSERNLRT